MSKTADGLKIRVGDVLWALVEWGEGQRGWVPVVVRKMDDHWAICDGVMHGRFHGMELRLYHPESNEMAGMALSKQVLRSNGLSD